MFGGSEVVTNRHRFRISGSFVGVVERRAFSGAFSPGIRTAGRMVVIGVLSGGGNDLTQLDRFRMLGER